MMKQKRMKDGVSVVFYRPCGKIIKWISVLTEAEINTTDFSLLEEE